VSNKRYLETLYYIRAQQHKYTQYGDAALKELNELKQLPWLRRLLKRRHAVKLDRTVTLNYGKAAMCGELFKYFSEVQTLDFYEGQQIPKTQTTSGSAS
jgi:hypothetical protein